MYIFQDFATECGVKEYLSTEVNMDIVHAKEIIKSLAEGIDPMTGEVLANDHVCNQGEVVRALYVALEMMGKKQKQNQPENAGKPWTTEDENMLRELFASGAPKKDICKTLKRTETGVAARLVHMGIIDERDMFRNRP